MVIWQINCLCLFDYLKNKNSPHIINKYGKVSTKRKNIIEKSSRD